MDPCSLILRQKFEAFENKRLKKLLRISYLRHMTGDWMRRKNNFLVCPQEPLLATVSGRKLPWFGRVMRQNSLSKTILQGTLNGGRRAAIGGGNAGRVTAKRLKNVPAPWTCSR